MKHGALKRGAWVAGSVALCLIAACEPPGKPKLEQEGAAVTDFAQLFSQNCSGCHGDNGKFGPARPINDPLYLALIPRDTLRDVIVNGRPGTSMPAWSMKEGGPLTDQQINALVDGIEKNWSRQVDTHTKPLPAYAAANEKGDANNGKKLFLRGCFACHGKGAAVGPVNEPDYLALASDQGLRASIITGRADLGMPNYQVLNAGKALTSQDVSDLVAYLATQRPAYAVAAQHVNENGPGQSGEMTKGNEGSGNGPGSPRHQEGEGNKSFGSSSQRGVK